MGKLHEHVRIHPAISHKKILYCKLLSFAVTVDVTDILQTSKQNFLFRAKNMSNLVMKRKNICQTIKKISVLFAILILMSALFLLRYYGSWYRLQHVEKQRRKHRRGKKTCQRRSNMPKESKKETCRKKQRKEKDDRRKKRGQNCTLLPGKNYQG